MGDAALKIQREERLDERVVPRTTVNVEIDLYSEHNFWSGLTMNMSEGGVFVATHRAVPPGTMLVLEMQLPDGGDPIVALAEVRWTRDYTGDPDVPPGLGLQFASLDDAALARVRSFVEGVREPLFYDD